MVVTKNVEGLCRRATFTEKDKDLSARIDRDIENHQGMPLTTVAEKNVSSCDGTVLYGTRVIQKTHARREPKKRFEVAAETLTTVIDDRRLLESN